MPTIDDIFDTYVIDEQIKDDAPEDARQAIILYTAQGMIDNGGIEYFVLAGPAMQRLEDVGAAYARAGHAELGGKIVEAARVIDELGRAEDDLEIPPTGQTLGEINKDAWEATESVYAFVHERFLPA